VNADERTRQPSWIPADMKAFTVHVSLCFRYMARELLDWGPVQDLTKCAIFSLGATVLEVCSRRELASEGEEWQELRRGLKRDHPILFLVYTELHDILIALMAESPLHRPSAHDCFAVFSFLKSDLEKELMFQRQYAASLQEKLEHVRGLVKFKRCKSAY